MFRIIDHSCIYPVSYTHLEASPHNLVDILDTLRAADVALGRVWSEPPTLNDVFLEITGRELRD